MNNENGVSELQFKRSNKVFGVYIEGIRVHGDGTEEVLDSTTVGSPREFGRIQAFKEQCEEKYGSGA